MRRHWLRFAGRLLGPIVVVASTCGLLDPARAQEAPAQEYQPAQFISNEDISFYAEFDGLDAHGEGWRKTAAYRILNETTTGAMLEQIFVQLWTKLPPESALGSLTPPERLTLIKHLARAGFCCGVSLGKKDDKKEKGAIVLILRKAFANPEVKPIVARLLQKLPGGGKKPQAVVKSGHKMVTGQEGDGRYYWWVEETRKEDVILILGPEDVDSYVFGVVEGKRPSVLTNPFRAELLSRQDGFERTGVVMLDLAAMANYNANDPRISALIAQRNLKRVDIQVGFQADALMSVTRVYPADEARAQASPDAEFARATIPGVPSGTLGLMVLALDFKSFLAGFRTNAVAAQQYDKFVATLKEKAKIRFEEDLIAPLGPKVTTYLAPAKASTAPGVALPGALSLLSRMGAGGLDALPKVAVLVDVASPAAFGNTLDALMGHVNRTLRSSYAAAMPPPPGGGPGPDGGAMPPRGRGRGPGGPAPEFRVMGGETKSYVFTVPPELSGAFPAGFRPTIRLGANQLALALSADVARQALDTKGPYVPPTEIGAAFGRLPAKLVWLLVLDPRNSAPEILASLPAKLQAGINTLTDSAAGAAADPTPAGANPAPAQPGMGQGGRMRRPGMGSDNAPSAASPQPGAPTTAGGAGAPGNAGALILKVDPEKLPAADAIRKLLFPAIYTIDAEGTTTRITTRAAFPPIPDPAVIGLIARAYRLQVSRAGAGANPGAGAGINPGAGAGAPPGGPRPGGQVPDASRAPEDRPRS